MKTDAFQRENDHSARFLDRSAIFGKNPKIYAMIITTARNVTQRKQTFSTRK